MIVSYVLLAILALVAMCEYFNRKTGVPTVASFPSARRKVAALLQKDCAARADRRPYHVIDLGSGGGHLCRAIARALPQAQVTGIELSYVPWRLSEMRRRLFGPANLAYKRADFWTQDCAQADAVVLFVTENIMERMAAKLRTELKPGTLVISNDTPLPGWQLVEVLANKLLGLFSSPIYVYRQS